MLLESRNMSRDDNKVTLNSSVLSQMTRRHNFVEQIAGYNLNFVVDKTNSGIDIKLT